MIRMAEFPVWLKLQDPPGVIDFRKSYFTFIQRIIIPETNISQVKLNQMYNQATIVVNRVLKVVGEFRIIDKSGICIDQPPEWIFYIFKQFKILAIPDHVFARQIPVHLFSELFFRKDRKSTRLNSSH